MTAYYADPVATAGDLYQQYVEIAQIATLAEFVREPEMVQTSFVAPPLGFVTA